MEKKQVWMNFIRRVFFLLAGIQVILGLIWILANLTFVPELAESALYLQAGKDLVTDEYMGILYPLLLRLLTVIGNGFCVVLYLLQLGVAFCAYYSFIANVLEGKFDISKLEKSLLAAYVVTFPVIMQVHVTVLPYSLASSMFVLVLSLLKKLLTTIGPMPKKTVVSIGTFYALGTLLLPDYGILMGIVIAVGFTLYGWKKERRWRVLLLTAFVAVFSVGMILSVTQTPGSLGRIQKSMGATMLSRFTWPYFERNGFFWGEEVKMLFDEDDLRSISMYPEKVLYEFGPQLEASVGKERANELYWKMATESIVIGKKEALSALGRDFLQNISGPIGVQIQWKGAGVSYAGWNYAWMSERAPIFTKYFVNFTSYCFDFLLLAAVAVYGLCSKKEKTGEAKKYRWLLALTITLITIWYTMNCNGMQDYMKVLPINILWCMLPVGAYIPCTIYEKENK